MSTQSQITQTQVLDAISRSTDVERQDAAQSGLQLLLNEFRRSLLQTSGQAATTVRYHGKIKSYLLQHPSNYPDSVAALSSLLDHFVAAQ